MPDSQPPVLDNSLSEETQASRTGGFSPITWIRDLALSVLIAIVLIVFIYQPVKVEGTSMMPGLQDQERIFINKFTYRFGIGRIERGDTVVFWFPMDISKSYIKRVIGLPGDVVEIDRGVGDFTAAFVLYRGLGRAIALPWGPKFVPAARQTYPTATRATLEKQATAYGPWMGLWSLYLWAATFVRTITDR